MEQKKNYIVGNISIYTIFFCILIFNLILYWFSISYSFFFSRNGKNILYRDFYECGFKAITDNKIILDIHFSVIGIIFLIYEMEVILFIPILLNYYSISLNLLFILFFSLFLLSLSYWYEWERYGLNWLF